MLPGRDGGWTWPVDDPTDATDELAVRSGLDHQRDLYQMRRLLPIDPIAPIPLEHRPPTVRPFRPGTDDEAAWVEANNAAFAHHPDQDRQSLATLHAQMAEPWFDPAGFLVVDGGDGVHASRVLAGFCWTKIHPPADGEPALGEIYVIGVAPSHHGRGLGEALVRAGLDHLAAKGLKVAMLYVDADNVAALRLYERLRFIPHLTRRVYSTG